MGCDEGGMLAWHLWQLNSIIRFLTLIMSTASTAEDLSWDFAADPSRDDYEQSEDSEEVYAQLMRDGASSEFLVS